jgi:Zn-dependent protease with chaperone function
VILITSVAPLVFVGRFSNRPRLGIWVWFLSFLSAGIACVAALLIASAEVLATYLELHRHPAGSSAWLLAVTASFAPWLFLALAGISAALINQRIEPLVQAAKVQAPLLQMALTDLEPFDGIPVKQVNVPVLIAMAHKRTIIISKLAIESLSSGELSAVLWHEARHVRARHNQLKQLAAFIRLLSPGLAASKSLVAEVSRLSELDADNSALRHASKTDLNSARQRFVSL